MPRACLLSNDVVHAPDMEDGNRRPQVQALLSNLPLLRNALLEGSVGTGNGYVYFSI